MDYKKIVDEVIQKLNDYEDATYWESLPSENYSDIEWVKNVENLGDYTTHGGSSHDGTDYEVVFKIVTTDWKEFFVAKNMTYSSWDSHYENTTFREVSAKKGTKTYFVEENRPKDRTESQKATISGVIAVLNADSESDYGYDFDIEKVKSIVGVKDFEYKDDYADDGGEVGDGSSYEVVYTLKLTDLEKEIFIWKNMTYSSWDSAYSNSDFRELVKKEENYTYYAV